DDRRGSQILMDHETDKQAAAMAERLNDALRASSASREATAPDRYRWERDAMKRSWNAASPISCRTWTITTAANCFAGFSISPSASRSLLARREPSPNE